MYFIRVCLLAVAFASAGAATLIAAGAGVATVAEAAVVGSITVRGNTRMDSDTVKSFLTIQPGKSFSNADIDDSLKALFATGLFADVSIYQSGSTLIVEVDENATINQVFFEGNKRLKDAALTGMVQAQSRGIFSPETVSSDVATIQEAYNRVGRSDAIVSSEVVPLANNRVNIVYRVNEGGKTKIRSIAFVGNNAFGAARLREVMSTKRSNFLSWLNNNDIYDPDRLAADEERLRRFYFNNGYADFQILSTSAVLDEGANEYNITITLDEGGRYTFGNIAIDSTLSGIDPDALYGQLATKPGKVYSAKRVEDSIIALTETVAANGYAFVEVVPRGNRNFDTGTIDVTYLIDQGARTYVERIVIVGNDMTRDYVIRREFDLSEGDAFNQVFIQKAKRRLEKLGIFERVDVSTRQGSGADQVVVVVRVEEKPSGDFSIGGGYSSASGALGEISFTEKNFMGRGQLLRVSGSFGEDSNNYRLSFTEPYFLGYRMSAGFDVSQSSQNANTSSRFSSDTTSGTIRFGLPLTEESGLSVFYTYSSSSTSIASSLLDTVGTQGDVKGELSAALAPPNSPSDWTRSGFGYNWTYNTIDNATTPRDGVRLEIGQIAYGAGGDASYLRSEAKAQLYSTLSEELDLVGLIQGRAGATTILGGNSGYRTLDNYFQGGSQIRGFAGSGFGPRDPLTGDALGGMYYWNATAEMNFPAPFLPESFGVRGALFADAGALWGVDSGGKSAIAGAGGGGATALGDVNDNAMRASVGASIIWNSPFGPLRFDYAEPVVREKYDKLRRFSFGLSTRF
ncbi:MAG: outer membrane protein assembly factor BamA [Nitratireductor sp.]|nr:outer membrane protein assembly factor BamA [Nitratireductor sp.]